VNWKKDRKTRGVKGAAMDRERGGERGRRISVSLFFSMLHRVFVLLLSSGLYDNPVGEGGRERLIKSVSFS
jgi:hypothetical protein